MSSEFLEAALLYASMGWRVFPLQPREKDKFAVKSWKNDCTTDEKQIRKWWGINPNYNIGVVTGNGIGVIDVDDKPEKHGGIYGSEMLADWEFDNGHIAETVCAKSGTGGMHYYYDIGDWDIRKCESPDLSIDLRCAGGYIVAPPSIHPETGQPYTWDISPEDMKPTPIGDIERACFQWVWDNRYKTKRDRGTDGMGRKNNDDSIPEGGRNAALFSEGRSMRSKGCSDEEILARLIGVNRIKCKPPLPDDEVEKIAESVCTVEPGFSDEVKNQQKQRGRPRKFEHNKVARKLIEEYGACLIDGETPAIRYNGRYHVGWDSFDSLIIDMHDDCTMTNRKEVKSYIQAKAETKHQSSPYLIAFKNGVLDVRTLEFRDWQNDDIIPNVIPHNWNPGAESKLLEDVLYKMACKDIATYMNLAEFIGVCMVRSAKLCPFFPVLIGVGSNGKSTYIELLKSVVGDENISGLQPKEITARFMGSHIVGKTANLGDDIASGYLDDKDCAVIKSIATGDLMFTDVKGGKGFHYQPYCTMVFSCNQFPRLADTTPGFMRRLFPIEFNAIFSTTDKDYDPMIGEKLRDESVLEYACVIGVEGLRRILAQNHPTPNEMSESMRGEIAREGNSGLQWFNDDQISAEHLIGMTKEEVYSEYLAWCERNGYSRTAMGSSAISALIGTYYRLSCSKSDHREYSGVRKTVKVYEPKVPTGATS